MKLCCPFKTSNTRQYLKNAIYTPFKVNLKPLHIFIPGFLLIKISYLELVEPFHYGINFVTHDDTVLHLKASVFGTSPSKLALYLIIYYIEMDLSTRKNGKIRPKMKRWNENFRFLLISIIAWNICAILYKKWNIFVSRSINRWQGRVGDLFRGVILIYIIIEYGTILHPSLLLAVRFGFVFNHI